MTKCNTSPKNFEVDDSQMDKVVGPFTFHELVRLIAASTTLIAVVLSLYLVLRHATNYTKPREQRHIIRILMMVPVYSVSSLLEIEWYKYSVDIEVIARCYEAFTLASFFALICSYVAPDLASQRLFFRDMQPVKKWTIISPIGLAAAIFKGQDGPFRTPRSGLTWFNIIYVSVYQYCFFRVITTIVAVITEHWNVYCESSNSPRFAYIWISAINMISITVAMACLIQVYVQLKDALADQKPGLKFIAIKLVIFLSFVQTTVISFATAHFSAVKPNKKMSYPDFNVGINAVLLCSEMALISILHLWAFPYRAYEPGAPGTFYPNPDLDNANPYHENRAEPKRGGFLGIKAYIDALNPWDFIKALAGGVAWLVCCRRHRRANNKYKEDVSMESFSPGNNSYDPGNDGAYNPAGSIPAISESAPHAAHPPPQYDEYSAGQGHYRTYSNEEQAGLISHSQANPESEVGVMPSHTSPEPIFRPPTRPASPYRQPAVDYEYPPTAYGSHLNPSSNGGEYHSQPPTSHWPPDNHI